MNDIDDLLAEVPKPAPDDGFTVQVMHALPERGGAVIELWTLAGWAGAFLAAFLLIGMGLNSGTVQYGEITMPALMLLGPIMAAFMAWVVAAEV